MAAQLVVLISGTGTNCRRFLMRSPLVNLGPKSCWSCRTAKRPYDRALAEQVKAYTPDLIVLAGWMHILSPAFLDCFPKQVINLHPALPGQFPGVEVIERTFEAYEHGEVDFGGCMVHRL